MSTTGGAVPELRRASGWAIAWAVLIIIAGFVMICLPFMAGLGIAVVVGSLLVISGIFHLIQAFHTKAAGPFLWQLLVGIVYVVGGFDIAIHPALGLVALTLVLGIILIIQGVVGIFGYFTHKALPGAGWILFNAICALVLGIIIWREGAAAAMWVVGTLVGLNLILSGITLLMLLSSVRRSLSTT
jgi:uncharacterized membrane protein HdeD (DUF308 family)